MAGQTLANIGGVHEPSIEVVHEGPLSIVTFNGAARDDEYRAYLAQMTEIMERNVALFDNHVVIHDCSYWTRSNPTHRKMQAEWIARNEATLKKGTAGITFVFTSMLVRGAFQALLWLTNMPTEYTITATLSQSLDWARDAQGPSFPAGFAARILVRDAARRARSA